MNIGIVMPVLNEAELIGEAVARLGDAKIVVADGGSCDQTVEIARETGAVVVVEAGGRGAQQNAGAAALGDVDALLFLHVDTVLPGGWRGEVVRLLSDGAALGAFRLCVPDHPILSAGANARSRWLSLPYGDQALFLRRATFKRLGGFRPLPIMEDFDLVRRARRLGRVALSPLAAVTSDRRWRQKGPLRTTIINQMMLAGWALGLPPTRLADIYRR